MGTDTAAMVLPIAPTDAMVLPTQCTVVTEEACVSICLVCGLDCFSAARKRNSNA